MLSSIIKKQIIQNEIDFNNNFKNLLKLSEYNNYLSNVSNLYIQHDNNNKSIYKLQNDKLNILKKYIIDSSELDNKLFHLNKLNTYIKKSELIYNNECYKS